MSTFPTISVVIPAFNAEKTLANSIISVLNQTICVHEIIVVNNNSTDSTAEVAEKFKNRIIFLNCFQQGVSNARNLGVSAASSEYIAFLDADDTWHSQKIEKQSSLINVSKKERCIFGSYANYVIENKSIGTSIRSVDDDDALINFKNLGHLPCITSSWIIKKDHYLIANGMNPAIDTAEDYEFICRLVKEGFVFKILREPLLNYQITPKSISHRNYVKQYLTAKYFKEYYFGYCPNISLEVYLSSVKYFSRIWIDAQANRFVRLSIIGFKSRKYLKSMGLVIIAFFANPIMITKKAKRQLRWR